MKRIYYIFFMMIWCIPTLCYASEDKFQLSCPSSVAANEEFTCNISINSSDEITSYSGNVEVDSGLTITGGNSSFSGTNADNGQKVTSVTLKATKSGQVSVSGYINKMVVSAKVEYINVTSKSEITNILVNDKSINFNKNTKEYNLKLDSSDGIFKIKAEGCDATYKSSDTVKLEAGAKASTTVTCGSTSYKINITRNDSRSNDSFLKSLTIGDKEIELSQGKYEYEVSVPNKTKKVSVVAKANSTKAKIEGAKEYELAVGENKITLVVTAENNDESTYKIVVTRKEIVNTNGKENLKSLTVNSLKIKKISSDMFLTLENSVDKLKLEYEFLDEDSKLTYNENTSLKVGLNKVPISVVDSNDKKSKYNLFIFKEENKNIIENNDKKIIEALKSKDVVVKLNNKDDKIVKKNILKNLNGNKITYEVIGDNNMILYSVSFTGKKFETYNKDINFEIEFNTKKSILKSDNYYNIRFIDDIYLPGNVIVNVFIKSKFEEKTQLFLYSYDGSKELKLLGDSLRKKDYYVNFKTNHLGELVLSNEEIKINQSNTILIIIIAIISTLIIGGIIAFIIIKKKKGTGKTKKIKKAKNITSEVVNNEEIIKDFAVNYNNCKTGNNETLDDEFSELLNNNYNDEDNDNRS